MDGFNGAPAGLHGLHGAPVGFPNHVEVQVRVMAKVHFRQFIARHFGDEFLQVVEQSAEPLFLPTVVYAHKWVVCLYILT